MDHTLDQRQDFRTKPIPDFFAILEIAYDTFIKNGFNVIKNKRETSWKYTSILPDDVAAKYRGNL